MSTTGKKKNYQKYKHMEAKHHTSEKPTNHRRNKKEIKICIETNETENMTTQNLWDSVAKR